MLMSLGMSHKAAMELDRFLRLLAVLRIILVIGGPQGQGVATAAMVLLVAILTHHASQFGIPMAAARLGQRLIRGATALAAATPTEAPPLMA